MKKMLKMGHGLELVGGDGHVFVPPECDIEIPVQWSQLVRRVPAYMKAKFGSKFCAQAVANEFKRVLPHPGRNPLVFYQFLAEVIRGSTPLMPMAEEGLGAPSGV